MKAKGSIRNPTLNPPDGAIKLRLTEQQSKKNWKWGQENACWTDDEWMV